MRRSFTGGAFIRYPLDLQSQGEFPFDGLITRMPLAVRDNGSGDGPSAAVSVHASFESIGPK
jgi:hypothetical protein